MFSRVPEETVPHFATQPSLIAGPNANLFPQAQSTPRGRPRGRPPGKAKAYSFQGSPCPSPASSAQFPVPSELPVVPDSDGSISRSPSAASAVSSGSADGAISIAESDGSSVRFPSAHSAVSSGSASSACRRGRPPGPSARPKAKAKAKAKPKAQAGTGRKSPKQKGPKRVNVNFLGPEHEFTVGEAAKYLDNRGRQIFSNVLEVHSNEVIFANGDIVHASNVRPARSTSAQNAIRAVEARQKLLFAHSMRTVEAIPNFDLTNVLKNRLLEPDEIEFGGYFSESDTASDCSHATDCSHDQVSESAQTNVYLAEISDFSPPSISGADIVVEEQSNPLPTRQFEFESDAKDIDFEQLPASTKKAGIQKALDDFQDSWVNSPASLGQWRAARRQYQKTQAGPEIVIFDATWVKQVRVDTSRPLGERLIAKVRLAPRGFRDKSLTKRDVASPCAAATTINMFLIEYLRRKHLEPDLDMVLVKVDFLKAFFQIKTKINRKEKRMGVLLPRELQGNAEGDNRKVMELLKEVPGTKRAPQQWFLDLSQIWRRYGLEQGRIDPCSFFKVGSNWQGVVMHVDDSLAAMPRRLVQELSAFFVQEKVQTRLLKVIDLNEPFECLGEEYIETSDGIRRNKNKFIDNVEQINVAQYNIKDKTLFNSGGTIYRKFRRRLGKLIWVIDVRPEFKYDLSILASQVQHLNLGIIHYINDLIATLKEKRVSLFLPVLPPGDPFIQGILDASLAGRPDASSQGARSIGLMVEGSTTYAPIDSMTSRRVRRKGTSSFCVELLTKVDTADMVFLLCVQYEEFRFGVRPSMARRIMLEIEGFQHDVSRTKTKAKVDTDALDAVERVYSLKNSIDVSKRRRMDISDLQDLLAHGDISEFRHIRGTSNPLDPGTKKYGKHGKSKTTACYQRMLMLFYEGQYVADLTRAPRMLQLFTQMRSLSSAWEEKTYRSLFTQHLN